MVGFILKISFQMQEVAINSIAMGQNDGDPKLLAAPLIQERDLRQILRLQ